MTQEDALRAAHYPHHVFGITTPWFFITMLEMGGWGCDWNSWEHTEKKKITKVLSIKKEV